MGNYPVTPLQRRICSLACELYSPLYCLLALGKRAHRRRLAQSGMQYFASRRRPDVHGVRTRRGVVVLLLLLLPPLLALVLVLLRGRHKLV